MNDGSQHDLRPGQLITHPSKPEWGLGRVLDVRGTRTVVYFRDIPGPKPEAAIRTLDTRYTTLYLASVQSDPILDRLPPYRDGRFVQPPHTRVTFEEGIATFRSLCPLFFKDPAYIGTVGATVATSTGERAYKVAAHELFRDTLGNNQLESLLAQGAVDEVRRRALAVEGQTNLLALFEKLAFKDGLADDQAAMRYFGSLSALLAAPRIGAELFNGYLSAVESLPAEGGTSPDKWTVATLLPYLAQPHRFMFLKPQVTKDCATRLTFDLAYKPDLQWLTYDRLLVMSHYLLERLRPYGAVDFIDVQSFIWLIGGGWL